jgi:DMSO/TMAO reductase YedYZ molybdopterin-dependent catalytic subunit
MRMPRGYVKDIPLAKAMDDEVIVAHEMNGAPLTPEHGFPLRLIVPGYYGTNSVKWLSAISLHDERPQSLFTTRLYNDWRSGGAVPVWETAVNSRLLAPAAGASLPLGAVEIFGRAWGHTACRPSNFPSMAAPAGLRLSWNRAPEVIPGKRFAPAGARLPPATMRSRSAPATCRAASSRKACILTRSSAWHSSSAKSGISAISFRSMSLLRVISGLPVFE